MHFVELFKALYSCNWCIKTIHTQISTVIQYILQRLSRTTATTATAAQDLNPSCYAWFYIKCYKMNLYDNYSDFFVLLKLVDASWSPRKRAICLKVVTWMTILTLSLVKSSCLNPSNLDFLDYSSLSVTIANNCGFYSVAFGNNHHTRTSVDCGDERKGTLLPQFQCTWWTFSMVMFNRILKLYWTSFILNNNDFSCANNILRLMWQDFTEARFFC